MGSNHFSLDFAPLPRERGLEAAVPVLAAAAGRVLVASAQSTGPNGNHVVLVHDAPYDGNAATGYTTRYLHLRDAPLVQESEIVGAGRQLGIIGSTGYTGGSVHLHFGIRYADDGSTSRSELRMVRIEGRHLVGYLTECAGGQRSAYYPSSNRH